MLNNIKYRLLSKLLLLFTFTIMVSFSFAQDWEKINTPSFGWPHKIIATKSGNVLAYFQDFGFFLTEDNAENWYKITDKITDNKSNLNQGALTVAPNGTLYYSEAEVFVSTDKGFTWEKIKNGTGTGVFASAVCNSNNKLFVVEQTMYGDNIYSYNPNDSKWSTINSGITAKKKYSITQYNDVLFLATADGVFTSTDEGANWTITSLTKSVGFITANSAGVLFAVKNSTLYRSEDSGNNWTTVTASIRISKMSIVSNNDIFALTTGAYAKLYKSTDNGDTWTQITTCPPLNYVVIENKGKLLAATREGIYSSVDEGANWQTSHNGIKAYSVTTIIQSKNNNLIFNAGQTLVRSIDNTVTWETINKQQLYLCSAINSDGDIFVGNMNGINRSTDNGATWDNVTGTLGLPVKSIAINSAKDLFVVIHNNGVFKSTDNGATWTDTQIPTSPYRYAIVVTNSGNIIASAEKSIFKSTDNGATWVEFSNGLDNSTLIKDLKVTPSGSIILASRRHDAIYISKDEGENWTEVYTAGEDEEYPKLTVTNGGVIYAGSSTGHGILRSNDNGNSWVQVPTGDMNNSVTELYSGNDNSVYAGVKGSGIYRKFDDEVTAVESQNIQLPLEFSLSQNYPNPFNPTTTIKYQVPVNSFVKLVIYNAIGQVVKTLVNSNKTAGKYSINFDATNLPTGVYIYRLQANDFVLNRKMVLMK